MNRSVLSIETFYSQDLQLFDTVEDCDKHRYYLSLLLLIEMTTNDSILDATITIFIGFLMRIFIFLNTKKGEGGDGDARGAPGIAQPQQQALAQSQTITTVAGATISDKKEYEKNNKFNYGAFDTFLNAIFSTIIFSTLMTFLPIVFDMISSCVDNYGALLTSIVSASLTLILDTTIVGASRDFDTIDNDQTFVVKVLRPIGGGHLVACEFGKTLNTIAPVIHIKIDDENEYNLYFNDDSTPGSISSVNDGKLFDCQDLKLFNIVKCGDRYYYDLSLLQLIEIQVSGNMKTCNFLDVSFTFAIRMCIFVNTKEGEVREVGNSAQQGEPAQKQQSQLQTTLDTKETKRNKKLNSCAFEVYSNAVLLVYQQFNQVNVVKVDHQHHLLQMLLVISGGDDDDNDVNNNDRSSSASPEKDGGSSKRSKKNRKKSSVKKREIKVKNHQKWII